MKKIAVIGIVVVLAVVILVIVYRPVQVQSSKAYEILESSRRAVENLESMKADAYFVQTTEADSIKNSSRYSMQIEFLRTEGMRINIKSCDYNSTGEGSGVVDSDGDRIPDTEEIVLGTDPNIRTGTDVDVAAYERMKQIYKNAWILDHTDNFYVYTPSIFKEYVTNFTLQPSSLLRYRYDFIPLADPLHLAELFDHAKKATYEGTETINVGNGSSKVEAYVVSYEFSYPITRFAEKAELRTWVSTEDYIPVKTELYAINKTTATAIKFVFGFDSYEKDAFIPAENLTLPEDLKILPRH